MIWPEACRLHFKLATHQGLSLRRPVHGLKQQRQIVEVSAHSRVAWPKAFFIDLERATIERLGFRKPVRLRKQYSEGVEVCSL
jgi:hypothetical protein